MKILFILGTRPEAIKLAPLIKAFHNNRNFKVKICSTGQHKEMLNQVLDFFNIVPDFNLNVMTENQSLFKLTSELMKKLQKVFEKENPDLIFVQGDTTTTFLGALAGFYTKTKVAHVEAGLRSHNKYAPFPEEINRVLVSHIADFHFTPTERAKENLLREGIPEDRIWVVGNTVIDALLMAREIVRKSDEKFYQYFDFIDFSKKIILVTGHRRESFGEPFRNICYALRDIAEEMKGEVEIVYPVHLNPNVRKPVFKILNGIKNIHLIDPLDYPHIVWLMDKSYLVLTDSGGIQEEAPSLGKPVLVMREVTERQEGIEAGTAKLVGTDRTKIVSNTIRLLTEPQEYEKMAIAVNPYGDGKSSQRILEIVRRIL
ncbi:MAG: UDP-N-acetylglucosamine 2-epimerase (non-hydrolyzing) [Thermotogaceae bacterium]|nr:UDP-N-acetylglucosamine 2-epimerase (non-hydrolyzing) [Thermotogaceae bacterium]